MNKNLIAITVLAASALTTQVVAADSGTVNFEGKITANACEIKSGSSAHKVTMGTLATNSFNGTGDTAGPKNFKLFLENCPTGVTTATVRFDGDDADGNKSVLALTGAGLPGVATGLGIQITDSKNKVITLYQESSAYNLQAGNNELDFVARYYATAATVGEGSADAATNFTIVYP